MYEVDESEATIHDLMEEDDEVFSTNFTNVKEKQSYENKQSFNSDPLNISNLSKINFVPRISSQNAKLSPDYPN